MKLLIISHNPMSTYNNMGRTLCGLFNRFSKEELCQLYIYPSVPDVDRCGSYYRITDKDVLKSYFLLKVKGNEIYPDLENHNLFDTKLVKVYEQSTSFNFNYESNRLFTA